MIRHWNENDLNLIAEIEKECFLIPWNLNMLISEYANPLYKCLVYEREQRILGYIGFFTVLDQVDIGNIAVMPGFRKQGIAKGLVAALLDFCKTNDIKNISLEVRKSNNAAIKLYESFGFKTEGVRKNYYEGTEDALIEDALIMWLKT